MAALFFLDSKGHKRLVNASVSDDNVFEEINKYVEKLNPNFFIHYIRVWKNEDGNTQYDVGSHTEFFLLVDQCCATCSHFLGGGDFGTCCTEDYGLWYSNNCCEKWEEKSNA